MVMERQPRRRRRLALSCLECRRRKIKCDRNDPCGHCRINKSECRFRLLNPDMQSLGSVELPESRPLTSTPARYGPIHQAQSPGAESTRTLPENPAAVPESLAPGRDKSMSQLAMSSALSGPRRFQYDDANRSGKPGFVNQHGPGSHIELYKTRTMTSNHWMGTAPEFRAIYECLRRAWNEEESHQFPNEETRNMTLQVMELRQKNKRAARDIKRHRPRGYMSLSEGALKLPPRAEADAMIDLYFAFWESAYRTLHEPTFRAEYEKLYDAPESVPIEQRLLVCLVIAAGSSMCTDDGSSSQYRENASSCVHIAQSWLSGPLEKDRLCVHGVQIHCLSLIVRQAWSISGDLIWLSCGSLIQTAMQIGLHRDPKHLPPMSILQAEVRRRLWATVVEMAVQSSLDAAMPPRIRLDDFDTEPPSNINDEDLSESTTALHPSPENTHTSMSVQRLLSQSLHARHRIVQHLNGLDSETSYTQTLEMSSDINEALQANFKFMNAKTGYNLPFHRNLLDFLVRRFLIPLHRPFTSAAKVNPAFNYSVITCLDSALAVLSPEPDEKFSSLLRTGGGPFREGIMCATTVVCIEFISRTNAQKLDGTLYRTPQYRDVLKRAMEDLKDLATQRIKCGETNIKGHLVLSMVTAYVETLESGDEPDGRILENAIHSLQSCHAILQSQVDTIESQTPREKNPTPSSLDSGFADIGLDWNFDFLDPSLVFGDDGRSQVI